MLTAAPFRFPAANANVVPLPSHPHQHLALSMLWVQPSCAVCAGASSVALVCSSLLAWEVERLPTCSFLGCGLCLVRGPLRSLAHFLVGCLSFSWLGFKRFLYILDTHLLSDLCSEIFTPNWYLAFFFFCRADLNFSDIQFTNIFLL